MYFLVMVTQELVRIGQPPAFAVIPPYQTNAAAVADCLIAIVSVSFHHFHFLLLPKSFLLLPIRHKQNTNPQLLLLRQKRSLMLMRCLQSRSRQTNPHFDCIFPRRNCSVSVRGSAHPHQDVRYVHVRNSDIHYGALLDKRRITITQILCLEKHLSPKL